VAAILLCAILAVCLAFPDTQIARQVKRVLIQAPARVLGRMSAARWVFVLCLLLAFAAFMAYAKSEGLFIAGPLAGDGMTWLVVFDIGAYVDVITVAVMIGAHIRVAAILDTARRAAARAKALLLRHPGLVVSRSRSGMARRARRGRRPSSRRPTSDDDGWPGFVSMFGPAPNLASG